MEEETIARDKIVYWIDKEFVQAKSNELFGRELNEAEIIQTTKYIESGLSFSIFEIIDIALKETVEDDKLKIIEKE
jgi:hypothetical protein